MLEKKSEIQIKMTTEEEHLPENLDTSMINLKPAVLLVEIEISELLANPSP